MSKLSFRARALDANKSLPVYHADDIPDLSDYSSVNRVVPQMPTGMEKEEETEHHLQRAITAQQIYGEAQRLIIPTPEAIFDDSDYQQLKQNKVNVPKQYVHVQAFTLEDELPEYDYDEDDEIWLKKFNMSRAIKLTEVEFERLYECLEKACGNQPETLSLSAAHFVLKSADDDVIQGLFDYWQRKRGVITNSTGSLATTKNDKKDATGPNHDPYIAFRRRVEKMQTRKNRKNDEASYEKMIKLRRDLQRACFILEMVKTREETKRDILRTTMDVCDKRYKHGDFSGELMMQCFDILRRRQSISDRRHIEQQARGSTSGVIGRREHDDQQRRIDANDDLRKRHLKAHKSRLPSTDGSSVLPENQQPYIEYLSEPEDEPVGPDGKFTFKRKKGVIYKAPRYDIYGNWPWVHPVEGGTAGHRYRYCHTTLSKSQRSIGFARRRRGRGGRILFDRAVWPLDEDLSENDSLELSQLANGFVGSAQSRVPPWPHFKALPHVLADREKHVVAIAMDKVKSSRNQSDERDKASKPSLHRSFSSQPTSKFRIHPYSKISSTSISNTAGTLQEETASTIAGSSSSAVNDKTLSKSTTNDIHSPTTTLPVLRTETVSESVAMQPKSNPLQPRLPSTAPSNAVYQLNFPILISNTSTHVTSTPVQSRKPLSRTENSTVVSNSTTITQHKPAKLSASRLSIVTPKALPGNGLNATATKSVVGTLDALPGFNTFRSTTNELNVQPTSEVK